MEISGLWNNVEEFVIRIDDLKSLLSHVYRIGPQIIPYIEDNIGIDLDTALHLRQASPHPDRLSFVPEVRVIPVNKLPVSVCIFDSVFIYAYIHLRAIKPWKKLVPDGVQKDVGVGILQVKKLL